MVKPLKKDLKLQSAMKDVLDLIKDLKVAYDREIRYRLETKYPHDLTKKAINELVKKREIRKTNLPGRRGAGDMPMFFTDYQIRRILMNSKPL
ncbi:MAG: hypothetical protein ACP6IP_10965 [Candidatus Njordarchaeia archaeon]